jgi:drug/metabolite transporter (DMT)-like permease
MFDDYVFIESFWSDLRAPPNIFLFLGGLIGGCCDFISMSAFRHVPAALGFPVFSGMSMAVGTLANYFVVGCTRLEFLLSGLLMCVVAVLVLACGQALPKRPIQAGDGKTPTPGAVVVPVDVITESSVNISEPELSAQLPSPVAPLKVYDDDVDIAALAELALASLSAAPPPNGALPNTTPPPDVVVNIAEVHKTHRQQLDALPVSPLNPNQWLAILGLLGLLKGSWGPLSTLGRSSNGGVVHTAFITFILGRVAAQVLMQPLVWVLRSSPDPPLLLQAWRMTRREKAAAVGTGMCCCLGYYCYFLGSQSLNKSAAFAISCCAPLWTIFLGAAMGELRNCTPLGRAVVSCSALLFMGAIPLLTLS